MWTAKEDGKQVKSPVTTPSDGSTLAGVATASLDTLRTFGARHKQARMERSHYAEALKEAQILSKLSAFDPHVAGTPPLGLELPASDIDVLCFAPDADCFIHVVWEAFATRDAFCVWQWIGADKPIVVRFADAGWIIEVFGQARPVSEQRGWRHFVVERRLLALGDDAFRVALMERRRGGMKTEPAFAAALGLDGDPYQALLDLGSWSDMALAALLMDRGF